MSPSIRGDLGPPQLTLPPTLRAELAHLPDGARLAARVAAILDIGRYRLELESAPPRPGAGGETQGPPRAAAAAGANPGTATSRPGLELALGRSLAVGQRLQLEVQRGGRGQPRLRLLELPAGGADLPIARLLAAALPRQAPPQQLVRELLRLVHAGPQPEPLGGPAKALVDALPEPMQLARSEALQRWFVDGGLGLEHKLGAEPGAHLAETLGRDWKALLLRLLQATARAPGEPAPAQGTRPTDAPGAGAGQAPRGEDGPGLRDLLEAGLARLQWHQAKAVQAQVEGALHWSVDIPFADARRQGSLALTLRRGAGGDADRRAWDASFALDLPTLGQLHGRLRLLEGELYTSLWAQRADSARLIGERLPGLEAALAASGLRVAATRCYHGLPAADAARTAAALPPLLDERA